MQQQQEERQPGAENIGHTSGVPQQDQDGRETELQQGDIENVSLGDDEDRDNEEDEDSAFAPDETEVGMDKEDYRDNVGEDPSDRRL